MRIYMIAAEHSSLSVHTMTVLHQRMKYADYVMTINLFEVAC